MRPSKFTKKILYPSIVLLAVSGVTWLIGHYSLEIQGEFGPEKHPVEIWSLRLHGLLALFGLVSLGMLLEHHVITYIKHKRRLITGLSLFIVSIWLAMSGYMLYYLSEDNWRTVFSFGHWVSGAVCVVLACMHIYGKKY